jgi:acetyltransferase-like isoleucine patch superfamily enzyme
MNLLTFSRRSAMMVIYYVFNYWITYFPIHFLRLCYLKYLMRIKIGKHSFVHMGCLFYDDVSIGNNSVIGRSCHLLGHISIGDNVSVTAQTYIFSSSHYKDSSTFEAFTKPVVISDRAWIGARAVITPGIKVGIGAVLGANSTATKDIPDYEVHAGSPAKKIGQRSRDLSYQLNYAPYLQ